MSTLSSQFPVFFHHNDVIRVEWAAGPECLSVCPSLEVQRCVTDHVGARGHQTGLLPSPLERHSFDD